MSHKFRNSLIAVLVGIGGITTLLVVAISPFLADVNKLLGTPGGGDTLSVLVSTYATVFLPFLLVAFVVIAAIAALIIWLIVKTVAETKANRNV